MTTTKQKIIFVLCLVGVSVVLGIVGHYLGLWLREMFPELAKAFQEWFSAIVMGEGE